jgi:hypothetical protein
MIASTLALTLAATRTANAMPQFARKYKMPCAGCHDAGAFPRLNDVGYKFRRAGFRMPENIGKDELSDFEVSDYFSARVQADSTTGLSAQSGSSMQSSNTFSGELNFYALTGSFQKYFATETELTISPSDGTEVENAYARVVYGDQNLWFEARAGIFHAFEGLGASDRSIGPSRPLIFDLTPNHNQDTLMRMVELNRIGAELGVQWRDTSLSVEVLNRAHPEVADGAIAPKATSTDAGGGKDIIVVANHILGTRSGLSAYWAHGEVPLPVDTAAFTSGTNTNTWNNKYDKFGAFASGGWGSLLFLGGVQLGYDHALDMSTGTTVTSRFTSLGGFVEANVGITPWATGYLRADYFDPSTSVSDNHVIAGTAGALIWRDYVSIAPEMQVRRLVGETDTSIIVHANVIY